MNSGRGVTSLDLWGGMPGEGVFGDGRGGGGLFGPLPVNPFTPPNGLPDNPFASAAPYSLIPLPLNPLLPNSFTQFSINVAFPSPLVGVQFSIATTPFGQTFYAFGPQVGKALTGVSWSYSVNNLTFRVGTGPAGMSQALTGGSWNVGAGYYGGGQYSWATGTWFWRGTSWGGGVLTPQIGIGLTYGWPAPTPTGTPGGY
jgi:hypothetical protein